MTEPPPIRLHLDGPESEIVFLALRRALDALEGIPGGRAEEERIALLKALTAVRNAIQKNGWGTIPEIFENCWVNGEPAARFYGFEE